MSSSSDSDCLFCTITAPRIAETEHFFTLFDVHPVVPRHATVIPKAHTDSLLDLTPEQWADLQGAIQLSIDAIKKTDLRKLYTDMHDNPPTPKAPVYCEKMLALDYLSATPDGYNFGVNDGKAAGRTIHHLHIHIIPRYFGDIESPEGGVRYVFPELANYTS